MQRSLATGLKRAYSSSARVLAADAATTLQINFSTPHQNIYKKKAVNSVVLPGERGEFSVSLGHSALISQLKPGVVAITHLNGDVEKFFVPGGFSITSADADTNISVSEAIPVADIDENLVRKNFQEATAAAAASPENSVAKATATIEQDTLRTMGLAVGITL